MTRHRKIVTRLKKRLTVKILNAKRRSIGIFWCDKELQRKENR